MWDEKVCRLLYPSIQFKDSSGFADVMTFILLTKNCELYCLLLSECLRFLSVPE